MTPALEQYTRDLAQRLSITMTPVRDEQYVHVSEAALSAPSVVGVRLSDSGPFTGWEIIATSEVDERPQFGYVSVRELAAEKPVWLVGLQLPVGWAFRFVGNTLIDCVSDSGKTIPLKISVDQT